jgi:hypothetical protein
VYEAFTEPSVTVDVWVYEGYSFNTSLYSKAKLLYEHIARHIVQVHNYARE